MPIKISERREDPRQGLPRALGAEVEFDGPDGTHHRHRVLEVSIGGLAFSIPERVPDIDREAMFANAVVRVGPHEIRGHLIIQNLTRGTGSGYRCGARFCAASDSDRNRMVALVSQLDALPSI